MHRLPVPVVFILVVAACGPFQSSLTPEKAKTILAESTYFMESVEMILVSGEAVTAGERDNYWHLNPLKFGVTSDSSAAAKFDLSPEASEAFSEVRMGLGRASPRSDKLNVYAVVAVPRDPVKRQVVRVEELSDVPDDDGTRVSFQWEYVGLPVEAAQRLTLGEPQYGVAVFLRENDQWTLKSVSFAPDDE